MEIKDLVKEARSANNNFTDALRKARIAGQVSDLVFVSFKIIPKFLCGVPIEAGGIEIMKVTIDGLEKNNQTILKSARDLALSKAKKAAFDALVKAVAMPCVADCPKKKNEKMTIDDAPQQVVKNTIISNPQKGKVEVVAFFSCEWAYTLECAMKEVVKKDAKEEEKTDETKDPKKDEKKDPKKDEKKDPKKDDKKDLKKDGKKAPKKDAKKDGNKARKNTGKKSASKKGKKK